MSTNPLTVLRPDMNVGGAVAVLNHPYRLRRLDVAPRGLDVAKRVVPGLFDGHGDRHGDEAIALNVDFLFARVRVAAPGGLH